MIKTGGLSHIHLTVCDMERSLRFYEQFFGMKEMFRVKRHLVFLTTPDSHDIITLHLAEAGDSKVGDNGGILHFGFRVANDAQMDVVADEVVKAGGAFIGQGNHGPGVLYALIKDPDGYEIELGTG